MRSGSYFRSAGPGHSGDAVTPRPVGWCWGNAIRPGRAGNDPPGLTPDRPSWYGCPASPTRDARGGRTRKPRQGGTERSQASTPRRGERRPWQDAGQAPTRPGVDGEPGWAARNPGVAGSPPGWYGRPAPPTRGAGAGIGPPPGGRPEAEGTARVAGPERRWYGYPASQPGRFGRQAGAQQDLAAGDHRSRARRRNVPQVGQRR